MTKDDILLAAVASEHERPGPLHKCIECKLMPANIGLQGRSRLLRESLIQFLAIDLSQGGSGGEPLALLIKEGGRRGKAREIPAPESFRSPHRLTL